ncbi:MAG: ATP-binding protein [Myxococcaceae bacterium]
MFKRLVKLPENKSFFLFGPRGAGKSTLLQSTFRDKKPVVFDLLDVELVDELSLHPKRFIERIGKDATTVIVDEIQKLPKLLDYVHALIEEKKIQFILTGSSARRLKQKGTNLLAGRALVRELYPFSTFELNENFDLTKALERGGLPDSYLANTGEDSADYLRAYTLTYLEKEIQQEQWVRKLEPFRRFLIIAAQMNGKIINRSSVARDLGVDDMTVESYFEILEDTYIGFRLRAFHRSPRKQIREAPKFFLIDPGIKRSLERTTRVPLLPQTTAFGDAFEHWVILEFIKLSKYFVLDWEFSYLQTKEGAEIDLIVSRPGQPLLLVEIKSKETVSKEDARTLETLGNDFKEPTEKWLLSRDPLPQTFGTTKAINWREALKNLETPTRVRP